MDCNGIKLQLSAYLDNELAKEEIIRVEKHLLGCKRCSLEWEKIKKIRNFFCSAEVKYLHEDFTPLLMSKLTIAREQKKGPENIIRRCLWNPVISLASVLILITSIFLITNHFIDKGERGERKHSLLDSYIKEHTNYTWEHPFANQTGYLAFNTISLERK